MLYPVADYSPILRPAQGEVDPSAYKQPGRNGGSTSGHSVTAQNFSIGTLHATRQSSVPFAKFCRRIQLKVCSLATCELANEGDSFLMYAPVSYTHLRAHET